jgi:hypothetical protein
MRVEAHTHFVKYRSEDGIERREVALPLDETDTSRPVQRRSRVRWDDVQGTYQCAHTGEPNRDSRLL